MANLWKDIAPTDRFRVQQVARFEGSHLQILTQLYRPIIKGDAYDLYLFLSQYKQETEGYLTSILASLDFGVVDFYHARVKLEGIGLLKTYRMGDNYLYVLNLPLSSDRFLNNTILRSLLIDQVGQATFDVLTEPYEDRADKTDSGQDISRSFVDAFHYRPSQESLNRSEKQAKTYRLGNASQEPSLLEKDSSFDWSVFLQSMSEHVANRKSLNQAPVKSTILFLHEYYGLDEIDMQAYVLQACDIETGEVDSQALVKLVRENYQAKAQDMPQKQEEKRQEPTPDSAKEKHQLSDQDQALVEASQVNSPIAFMTSIKEQRGGYVTRSEKYTIEEVAKSSHLPKEVVNILIHYILVVKDNDVVNANFANAIANNWAQKNISSAGQAIQYVKEWQKDLDKKAQNRSYSKPGRKLVRDEALPDWAKSSKEDQSSQDQAMSEDQKKQFQERLNRIRNKNT